MEVYVLQGCIVRCLLVHLKHHWNLSYVELRKTKRENSLVSSVFVSYGGCFIGKCKIWFQNLANKHIYVGLKSQLIFEYLLWVIRYAD